MLLNGNDRTLIYRSEGHAGNTPWGENVICSAASILAFTLAENVNRAEGVGWVTDCDVRLEDAENCVVKCVAADDETFGEMARAYFAVSAGYDLLAARYPEAVELDYAITPKGLSI
jgi:uncharacterized protein YsxB (DUF464 family)